MLLTSNIKNVIARLEKYQTELPKALAKVVSDPQHYVERLRLHAKLTLETLAESQEQREVIPLFLQTLTAETLGGGMLFSLSVPKTSNDESVGNIATARAAFMESRPARRAGKPLSLQDEANLNLAREAVRQWVTYEKIIDERDAGYSREEIVERLLWIMGISEGQKFGQRPESAGGATKLYTDAMRAAGDHLSARVQAFWEMTAEGGAQSTGADTSAAARKEFVTVGSARHARVLDAVTAAQWLARVLAVWRIELRAWLRLAIQRELHTLHYRMNAAAPGLPGI